MRAIGFAILILYATVAFSQILGNDQALQNKLKSEQLFPSENPEYNTASTSASTFQEPVRDSTYIIGPGDELRIVFLGKVSETEYRIVIDGEGNLHIPKIGVLPTNKSFRDVKQDVLNLLGQKSKGSEVLIQLVKIKPIKISVSGEVVFPGSYVFYSTVRLAEVIQKANTNQTNVINYLQNASLRNIEVHSFHDQVASYDFQDFLLNGTASQNPILASGDKVVVPIRIRSVTISGAVSRPRTYDYRSGSIIDLIRLAGGFAPNADSGLIRVTSFQPDGTTLSTKTLRYPEECAGYRVNPDDQITISSIPFWHEALTITITGRVHNPGIYSLNKGSSAKEIIETAGGLLEDADTAVIYLNRTQYLNNLSNNSFRSQLNDFSVTNASILGISGIDGTVRTEDLSIKLVDGDILLVPKKIYNVSVTGSVLRPGLVFFEPNKGWKYYITQAGGFDGNAYAKYTKVFKKKQSAWINASSAVSIDAGDIILVPEKPPEYNWNKFKDVLTITSGLLSIGATLLILSKQ